MRIELHEIEKLTLDQFADKHGLVMEVRERHGHDDSDRYFARFKDCSIREGMFLVGAFGNGPTPEKAIADYANRIKGTVLSLSYYERGCCGHRDIPVPVLL